MFNRCQSMPQHSSKQSHCTTFTGTMCDSQHKLNWNHAPKPGQLSEQRRDSGQIWEHLPKQTPMFTGTLIIEILDPASASHTARTLLSQLDLSFFSSGVVSFSGGFPTSTGRWQFPGCLSDGMNRLYPISGGCQILRQYAVFMNVGRLPKCGVNPVHGNIWRQENNQCTTTKRLSSVFHRIILGVFLFQVIKDRT